MEPDSESLPSFSPPLTSCPSKTNNVVSSVLNTMLGWTGYTGRPPFASLTISNKDFLPEGVPVDTTPASGVARGTYPAPLSPTTKWVTAAVTANVYADNKEVSATKRASVLCTGFFTSFTPSRDFISLRVFVTVR